MSDAASRTAAAIQQYGQPATLRRNTLGPSNLRIPFDVAVMAIVRGYQPQELVGDIQIGDRQVIISNAEIAAAQWPGPPRDQDQFIVDDRASRIMGPPESIQIGDCVVRHTFRIRG